MILARYLLLQLTGPFLFGLSLFSGVLLLDKLFDVVDLLVNKGVSLLLSARIFFLFLPTVLSLSVPMSLLLACLLTFGRLSEDNEVTALRASGVSFRGILAPPLALAAVLSAFLIPFNTRWAPRSISGFRALDHEIAQQDPLIKIEPGQFTMVRNIRLFAGEVDRNQNALRRVWIYQRLEGFSQRIYAVTGAARTDARGLTLDLRDGQIERVSKAQPKDLVHIRFKHYTLQVPFAEVSDDRQKSWRERTSAELDAEIARRREAGTPDDEVRGEYHLRYAIAFAPLALALLGISLGMTLERGGRGVGFGAAVGVLFTYYLLLILGLDLAQRGSLPPLPALWMANLTALAAGAALYHRRLSL
jgi:lipopolysaccharide export system permease protein